MEESVHVNVTERSFISGTKVPSSKSDGVFLIASNYKLNNGQIREKV